MPTISGVWKWNDILPVPSSMISQKINFTSGENGALSGIAIANSGGQTSMLYTPIEYTIYNSGSNLWFNEDCKTMDFGSEPQTVSQDFYNYLTANSVQQEEPIVPTVTGVWKWNDNLNSALSGISAKTETTFISNGNTYYGMQIQPSGRNVKILYATAYDTAWTDVFNGSWTNDAYATVDFGNTAVEMEQQFYASFTTVATQQSTPTTTKTVSSDNLAEFKAMCDETYAAIGNIPIVSTELVNLGTLSTSGTLTADQVTQIGTTTIGVTARASVNGVTRFYERVNISGTTATLVSADDDALHVLTVNLSTRAYTLSDVALGGGGGGKQLYQHMVAGTEGNFSLLLLFISSDSTPITDAFDFSSYTNIDEGLFANGYLKDIVGYHPVVNVFFAGDSGLRVAYITADSEYETYDSFWTGLRDVVTPL